MNINPIRVELPYPSLDEIKPDLEAARIIAPAYASLYTSETTASFQYMYHYFYFDEYKMEKFAYTLENIAIAEMIHIEILAKMLLKLGVDPVYTVNPPMRPYYNTSMVSYSKHPQKMLIDDIDAELRAISDYQSMVKRLRNEQVSAVIQRIILDEMLHLEEFKSLLAKLNSNKG